MASVVLKNLTKIFPASGGKAVPAVCDLNLSVHDREFLVLVGPSGCGKTTTLRMIAGLETATSGSIHIDDVLVNDVSPKDRDIGMVFQNYALYPHLSVYDNLSFGLKLRKFSRQEIETRVQEAAEWLGLSELLKRKPGALSGGQRQRVAVGRALVRKPKVFLFDEPLSNLDARMRVQMRTELLRLHQRIGATMIYVTHDQVEAMTMGDRIVVMDQGRALQVAPPMDLYRQPDDLVVAGFLGSPPMNFFRGQLRARGEEICFEEEHSSPADQSGPARRDMVMPTRLASMLKTSLNKPLVLGIRPEHMMLAAPSSPGQEGALKVGVVDLVETLGAETLVHLHHGSHQYIIRVPGTDAFRVGMEQVVRLNLEQVSFFDAKTGRRIR
jgi:multiple sugar transport system ATP-binding protein